MRLGVAERADIVVDFAKFPLGTELYLVNQLLQIDTRGPGNVQAPGTKLLKIIVDRNPPSRTRAVVPNVLRPLPAAHRRGLRRRAGAPLGVRALSGMWTVNNQLFNVNAPRAIVTQGQRAEVWEFVNPDNGWQHPIHIHFEEGRIIEQDRQRGQRARAGARAGAQGRLRARRGRDHAGVLPLPRFHRASIPCTVTT